MGLYRKIDMMERMESAVLIEKIISLNAEGSREIYRHLYLYGEAELTKAATEKLVTTYLSVHPHMSLNRFTGITFAHSVIDALIKQDIFTSLAEYVWYLSQCDLLVIEDIQELPGSKGIMEYLYVILDKRLEQGLPFLITGNVIPSAMPKLEPRILTILEGSLIWKLT